MIWKRIKRGLKLAGIVLAIVLPLLGGYIWWQWETVSDYVNREILSEYKSRALAKAIDKQVKSLPAVDSVKVLRLSESVSVPGQSPFIKGIYGGMLYDTQTEEISGSSAQQLADLWRRQSVFENRVMCHEPHHAVFFYHQGKEVGRAMICFYCTNAAIPSSFLGDGLIGFDSTTPEYALLKKAIEGLVGAHK